MEPEPKITDQALSGDYQVNISELSIEIQNPGDIPLPSPDTGPTLPEHEIIYSDSQIIEFSKKLLARHIGTNNFYLTQK
jgi:hypothetical protein